MPENKKRSSPSMGSKLLKWIGIITAVISLVLGIREVINIFLRRAETAELIKERKAEAAELIKTARGLAAAGRYSKAWDNAVKAVEIDPGQLDAQVSIAMEWLRNISVSSAGGEQTFSEIIDKVTPT